MRLAIALIALLFVLGPALVIAGLYLLGGNPWALMASGVFLMVCGHLLRLGFMNG